MAVAKGEAAAIAVHGRGVINPFGRAGTDGEAAVVNAPGTLVRHKENL